MSETSRTPLIGLDERASRLGVGERYVRRLVEERRLDRTARLGVPPRHRGPLHRELVAWSLDLRA